VLSNGTRGIKAWERLRGQWVSITCSRDKVNAVIISEDKYEELKSKCVGYPAKKGMTKYYNEFVAMNPITPNYAGSESGSGVHFHDQRNTAFQAGNNLMDHFTFLENPGGTQFKTGPYSDVTIKRPVSQCVT